MKENLEGAASYIKAKKGELASKTFRAIAGASLVTSMLSACGPVEGATLDIQPSPTVPVATEVTEVLTDNQEVGKGKLFEEVDDEKNMEKGAQNSFRGVIMDPEENSLWRMGEKDYEIAGDYPGVFGGWVEKTSVPGASEEEDVRYGRWVNPEGMGIVEFKKVKEGEYYGGIFMDEEGNIWRMVDEDYELANDEPGSFNGWIEDEFIPADERKEGIRWGRWSNSEGRGRVRFEKVSLEGNQQLSVENALEELSEEKINELAEKLVCIEGPTCINEVVGRPNYISAEIISTGIVRNIDLKNSTTGDVIGSATVAEVVTRDIEENPVVVDILLQAELDSESGVNQYPTSYSAMQVSLKHKNGEEVNLQEINDEARQIHSLEEWRALMSEGTMWTFLFQKDGLFGGADELVSTNLTHPENVKAIQEFLESKGKSDLADEILVPSGTSDRL